MIYKKIICVLFFFLMTAVPSFAEKIPVKISPIQLISTHHDEVETGDWVKFEIIDDIYINDSLCIKKGTDAIGIVDYVHQNGWGGDSAEIYFKKFYTKDVNNKKVSIVCPLVLSGNSEMANGSRQVPSVGIFAYGGAFFRVLRLSYLLRGAEIYLEPDTVTYNIFMEQ